MNHDKLTSTHKRLTLIFTWVVFCIVLVLGLSTIFAKYYNETRIAKRDFSRTTSQILGVIEEDKNFPTQFLRRQVLENAGRLWELKGRYSDSPLLSTSFFIINNNEIVFQNILEKPEFDGLRERQGPSVYIDENTLIQRISLERSLLGDEVVFFKKMRYNFGDLLGETMYLLLMNAIFSLLFYFIGHRFVGRALKPVEENMNDMSDFIHNAGHELKTPLAVMRGNLQVMQSEESYDSKLLKKSMRHVDSMNDLIEGLREISEVGKSWKKEGVALAIEVARVVNTHEEFARASHVSIENTAQGALIVHANIQELDILLSNIIKNAIKYNKRWGIVEIFFDKNVLVIRDTGKGISLEDQAKIFERFYQWSEARSEEGFWIGLALVKKIADANNWKIQVKSEIGKGTDFRISF